MNKKERNNIGNLYGDIPARKPTFQTYSSFYNRCVRSHGGNGSSIVQEAIAASVRENAHQELPRQPHSLGLTLRTWQRTHGRRTLSPAQPLDPGVPSTASGPWL